MFEQCLLLRFADTVWTNLANSSSSPRRYLAHTAAFSRKHTMAQIYDFLCNKLRFSREDMRLWKISIKDDVSMLIVFSADRLSLEPVAKMI
jgi:hypothetical protein